MTKPLKYLLVLTVLLALLIIAISTRYDVVAQNVAAGATIIRGNVYLLDRWTGAVFLLYSNKKLRVQKDTRDE